LRFFLIWIFFCVFFFAFLFKFIDYIYKTISHISALTVILVWNRPFNSAFPLFFSLLRVLLSVPFLFEINNYSNNLLKVILIKNFFYPKFYLKELSSISNRLLRIRGFIKSIIRRLSRILCRNGKTELKSQFQTNITVRAEVWLMDLYK